MIIEYELQGSDKLHKGCFDTTGFWVRFEEESETIDGKKHIDGYKIYNHGSFSFYHEDKEVALEVYDTLTAIMTQHVESYQIKGLGYIDSYLE